VLPPVFALLLLLLSRLFSSAAREATAAAEVEGAVEERMDDFFSRFGAVPTSVASPAVVRPSAEVRGLGGTGEGRRGATPEVEERGGGVSL